MTTTAKRPVFLTIVDIYDKNNWTIVYKVSGGNVTEAGVLSRNIKVILASGEPVISEAAFTALFPRVLKVDSLSA